MNLLAVVLLMPLAAFLLLLAVPRSSPQASRIGALWLSLATFLASVGLLWWFDRGAAGDQFTLDIPWISTPDIHFHIAANGVSELHGQISRQMWQSLYPNTPVEKTISKLP